MNGVPDPGYVAARRVLLDALDALAAQRGAVVLVGAQAIYLHTGEGDLAVAPYTLDADLALVPDQLRALPDLTERLEAAGFRRTEHIGIWAKTVEVQGRVGEVTVDLLVPAPLGGPGRRAARLEGHGARLARKARGLEAAVVDRTNLSVGAFEPGDPRCFEIAVAGPAALLVAKLHKLAERGGGERVRDKDALDVLRLLRRVATERLAERLTALRADPMAGEVTGAAIDHLRTMFGDHRAIGSQMAARAAAPLEDPETIAASCAALTRDLLAALEAAREP